MSNPSEDRFVLFQFPCGCGTNLVIHGEYFVGGRFSSRQFVICPSCKKEHDLPTKALRFFYQKENYWVPVPGF